MAACAMGRETGPDFSACNAPSGWEAIAERAEGRTLFFGETHGTNESPDVFYRYVCAASAQPGRTVVALEINSALEDGLARAFAADDQREALQQELESHWKLDDGRGSSAMFELVLRLNELREAGRDLQFVLVQQLSGLPDFKNSEEKASVS